MGKIEESLKKIPFSPMATTGKSSYLKKLHIQGVYNGGLVGSGYFYLKNIDLSNRHFTININLYKSVIPVHYHIKTSVFSTLGAINGFSFRLLFSVQVHFREGWESQLMIFRNTHPNNMLA